MKHQQQKVKKERKMKKESALSGVRRPRSAYVLFSVASRVEVKQQLGENAQMVDVMRELARKWKEMTPDEKEPWVEAAKQDQLRYESEMNETKA